MIFLFVNLIYCKIKKNVACPLWATVNDYYDSLFITLKY